MRDYYAGALNSKKPKKRCIGSPDQPECAEMILDHGKVERCLECRASVTRANQKKYWTNRKRKRRLHHMTDDQPRT